MRSSHSPSDRVGPPTAARDRLSGFPRLLSAQAPVNFVPVAHQGEDEQHHRNQQQPGRFRGVDGMAMMPVRMRVRLQIGLWIRGRHASL